MHIASRCYNKRYRNDALLQKQSKEKRLGTTLRNQILPHQRCGHYTDGNRCTSKIVPLAKYCLKRILLYTAVVSIKGMADTSSE